MARIHPHGWQEIAADEQASLGLQRELDTLRRLAGALPDDVAIYHGVHWTHLAGPHTVIDDIDFVIVGAHGQIILIEQVSGYLTETPQGLQRKRPGKSPPTSTVASTLAHTAATLGGRLRRALSDGSEKSMAPGIDALLYCPDYTVRGAGSAGLPPERIVDASRRDTLAMIILELLAERPNKPDTAPRESPPTELLNRIHRFFSDLLQLAPEASAIVGEAQGVTTRLSGGLASWARRLHFSPHRLRVIGTAGSGKTQLAIAAIHDAATAGRRTLYVCYNRPLADHISRVLTADRLAHHVEVATFHQLCDRIARQHGQIPDFTQPDAFRRLEQLVASLSDDDLKTWQFDELIVDEGQDFEPDWASALFRLLVPTGRAWWLEDPMQNLYGRPSVTLPQPADWVELRCDINYRTPRAVLDSIAAITRDTSFISNHSSGSPILGKKPEILSYRDDAGLIEQTKRAIGLGIAAGFKRNMIAVLSYRGREKSLLAKQERLGPYSLRSFSGHYDLLGNPTHSSGEILIDSIMRFKGQAAPCVVLTEVEFATLDETAQRRIFVGATRATLALFLVAHENSARLLAEKIGEP